MPAGSGGGGGKYIIFEGVSAYGNNVFVDDIEIVAPSSLSGYVYDYNGNPVEGADVGKVSGISTITGPAGDYNLIPLSGGMQDFSCFKTGYNEVVVSIDIPEGGTASYNFTLLEPQMAIAPASINTGLGEVEAETFELEIANAGNGLLGWQASEIGSGTCDYTIAKEDSIGDGWNGGTIDVLVNGSVVLDDITLAEVDEFGPVNFIFPVSIGDEITTLFTPDLYPYECRYTIYDGNSNQVWYAAGSYPFGPPDIVEGQLFGIGCDVPWLSLDNYTGQVDPFGGTATVLVTVDASLVQPAPESLGVYTADILFTSPSGLESITIPVSLTIRSPMDLNIILLDAAQGKFLLKWKYFTIGRAEFDHFEIFRNDVLHATTTEPNFTELLTDPDIYCYKVYAVYSDGFVSEPSNTECITFPVPLVPVANWAILLGALLIGTYAFFMIRRRL
jgi:hypothetical protein